MHLRFLVQPLRWFKLQTISGNKKVMSFQSSLQPMLSLMRCIGVYLESPDNKDAPGRLRCRTICFVVLTFFLNIFSNLANLATFANSLGESGAWKVFRNRRLSSTTVWNMFIIALNYAFVTTGCHLSLLMCVYSRKWLDLVRVLREIEQKKVFEKADFQTFRSIYVVGFRFVMVAAVLINSITWSIGFLKSKASVTFFIFSFFRYVFTIYVVSGAVMFFCLGWMVTIQFTILAQRVKQAADNGRYNKVNNWNKKIDTWRHHHYLISDLADKISHLYGPFLLVFVTYSFVIMINSSFMLLTYLFGESFKMVDFIVHGVSLVLQVSFFCSLTYVPHRLRESAIQFSKQLRTLQLDVNELQNKVNFFIVEVLQSLPRISALGLFDVNLGLIPTLAGTTLTYLIILFQFQFSEQS